MAVGWALLLEGLGSALGFGDLDLDHVDGDALDRPSLVEDPGVDSPELAAV